MLIYYEMTCLVRTFWRLEEIKPYVNLSGTAEKFKVLGDDLILPSLVLQHFNISQKGIGFNCVYLMKLVTEWPNISANNPDPGSGSKNLILIQDHF